MHGLLTRVVVNAGVAAALLAVIGVGFAEVAAPMAAQAVGGGGGPDDTATRLQAAIRGRLPVLMAACGAALVALWEVALYLYRGGPPAAAKAAPAAPDEAERLLEDLLRQADAAMGEPAAVEGRTAGHEFTRTGGEDPRPGDRGATILTREP